MQMVLALADSQLPFAASSVKPAAASAISVALNLFLGKCGSRMGEKSKVQTQPHL